MGDNPAPSQAQCPGAAMPVGLAVAPAESAPDFIALWRSERTRLVVGPGMSIAGRLAFEEAITIEGTFRGELVCTELLIIAEQGRVEARLRCSRVLVLGEFRGEMIGGKRVLFGPRSRVRGRVETELLTVLDGALVEGELRVSGGRLAP